MRVIDADKVVAWLTGKKGIRTANMTMADKFRIAFVNAMYDGQFDLDENMGNIKKTPKCENLDSEKGVVKRPTNVVNILLQCLIP